MDRKCISSFCSRGPDWLSGKVLNNVSCHHDMTEIQSGAKSIGEMIAILDFI